MQGRHQGGYLNNGMKNKTDNANYTIKMNLIRGKANLRISQGFQQSLFTKVLPMTLRVLRLHPVLCFVSEKYLFMPVLIVTN